MRQQITRRIALKGGLASLAATFAQTALIGCEEASPTISSTSPDQSPESVRADAEGMETGQAADMFLSEPDQVDASMSADQGMSDAESIIEMADIEMLDQSGPVIPPDFPLREVPSRPALASLLPMIGPLQEANDLGVKLPEGFSVRIIAESDQPVPGQTHAWHWAPDGGATYPTEDGGWIYVSNSEVVIVGGVSAIRFNADGELIDAYPILERTSKNCAGGITPWHTWLSCEERDRGLVYECSPWGDQEAIARPALGVFKHEAVAVDPVHGHLYLTEDQRDGRLYRFTADQTNDLGDPVLSSGTLEVATVTDTGQVTWTALIDPEFEGEIPTREQIPTSTAFDGGEGIWYHQSVIYFSTKGDNKVWAYYIERAELEVVYDGNDYLEGVDNLTVSCCGDVLVAEDGGEMRIVAITPSGELVTLVQLEGHDDSEVTGPAFDPSGTRLYFSSQRGTSGRDRGGITYEVTGPFHQLI